MTARPTAIAAEVELRLVMPHTAKVPVAVDLGYDVDDPFAVTAAFRGDEGTVEWVFARDLLHEGLDRPSGEGDVQVWPSSTAGSSVVCLSLSSPSGRALFEVPLGELAEFLGRTYAAVPTGAEADHVDVDAELALLLWAEPET